MSGDELTLFDLPATGAEPLTGPSGRPFTEEQARAVRERAGSLLLYANAGSGKTSVLVERFVRMVLDDGLAPRDVLAITFTEKAAGELRTRVRQRFAELGAREAARDTEAAWISTIHGFCARVLRGHAIGAGLDPGFAVLDEATARGVRDAAFDRALEGFLDDGGAAALDVAAAYGVDRLAAMVRDAHDELRSRGQTQPRLPAVPHPDPPDAERRALLEACGPAQRTLAAARNGKVVDAALAAVAGCREALEGLGGGELAGAVALREAALKGSANALKTPEVQAYATALEAYATACANSRAAGVLALLDDLLRRYASAYAAAKRTRGALDFDDLELLTRDLLAGDEALRRQLRERFARIMVDEFQDTNPLQLELLELLSSDNLFVVGDEFQSIYGFRHADVGVFRRLRSSLAARDRVASLSGNFRSAPAILDALNAAFAPRFARGFVPLAPMLPREPGDGPRVELLLTDTRAWGTADAPALGEGFPPGTPAWRVAEARLLAQRVRELVDAGEAEPRDVVVLLRATGAMPVFERALEDQGLLTYASGGAGYWSRQQVQDLVAYLAALANTRDEEALLTVLASPLCGASADALAIVTRTGHALGRGIWRALRDALVDGDGADGLAARLPEADLPRLSAFAARFDAERRLAPRVPIAELLRRAVTRTGYDLHVLALPGGPRRMANVHKLTRLAAAYEEANGRDLRGFVDLATAEEEAGGREPDAPVEAGGVQAVRLMTVHAAKGLEFPVVCLADLGRQPALRPPDLVVRDARVGLRVVGLDSPKGVPALDHAELVDRAQVEAGEEEDRIMYVAMTRAQRRLIVSGAANPERWPEDKPSAPPIGWVGHALVPNADLRMLEAGGDPAADFETHVNGFTAHVRLMVNAPATVGSVLREDALAPHPEREAGAPPHGTAGSPSAAAPPPSVVSPAGPAAPVAPMPRPDALSYTALSAYATCGYRFYLQRVLRLPDEPAPGRGGSGSAPAAAGGLDARVRGIVVHALLEELDFASPARPDPARAAELAAAEGHVLTPADAAEAANLAAAFARSPLCARLAAARDVRREHPFAFTLPDDAPLLTGVVDIRGVEPDGTTLVVDVKTDRTHGESLEALVERDYATQRRIYALAGLRQAARAVEVAYCFLERPAETVSHRYTPEDLPRLEAELHRLVEGVARGRYPVTDRPHRDLCATCPGRPALCSHPESLTLREDPLD